MEDDLCINITRASSLEKRKADKVTSVSSTKNSKARANSAGQSRHLEPSKVISKPTKRKATDKREHVKSKVELAESSDDDELIDNSPVEVAFNALDPDGHHARPRDLALISSAKSSKGPSIPVATANIFTRQSFSAPSLQLNGRLCKLLEKPVAEGGFGLGSCTRVQNVSLPLLAAGHNILMKSQTGSGKTLAYLLPIMNQLMSTGDSATTTASRSAGTRALIVAPTRELCTQISEVVQRLTSVNVNIVAGCISGGEKKKSEKARLRKGLTIVVSTPGRLLDHLKTTEAFTLSQLQFVVLDEADRLLDMGFEKTVLEICSILRGDPINPSTKLADKAQPDSTNGHAATNASRGHLQRKWTDQNAKLAKKCSHPEKLVFIMASATLTSAVQRLAVPVMKSAPFKLVDADVEHVLSLTAEQALNEDLSRQLQKEFDRKRAGGVVNFDDDNSSPPLAPTSLTKETKSTGGTTLTKGEVIEAPAQLSQYYMLVTSKWRLPALVSFLYTHRHLKCMVFFATCDSVDYHALLMRQAAWPSEAEPDFSRYVEHASTRNSYSEFGSASSQWLNDESEVATSKKKFMSAGDSNAKPSYALAGMDAVSYSGMLGEDCQIYRLHGNMVQKTRMQVFREFAAAKAGILFCTDVAARGLDLPHVDWIVQYDPPCDTTDYVHRAGRTARRGESGSALLFVLPSEQMYIPLLQSYSLRVEPLSLQSLFLETAQFVPGVKKFKNIDELTAVLLQRRLENTVASNKWLTAAAKQTFRSFVRAYATHSGDTKGIFAVQKLHLGHVAKSFGLSENPAVMRSHDDVLGKIMNGTYAVHADGNEQDAKTKKMSREERDLKYSLSGSKRMLGESTKNISKRSKVDQQLRANKSDTELDTPVPARVQSAPVQKLKQAGDLKKVNATSSGGSRLTVSGKFRKAGGTGYFRKKLRAQINDEFRS